MAGRHDAASCIQTARDPCRREAPGRGGPATTLRIARGSTVSTSAQGKQVIDEAADRAGRVISPEHFGVSLGYAREPLDERTVTTITARARGHDPRKLVPVGRVELREHVERFIDRGFSKFVVRPLAPPHSWRAELEDIAAAVGELQT